MNHTHEKIPQYQQSSGADVLHTLGAFQKVDHIVNKTYLPQIEKLLIGRCPEGPDSPKVEESVCLFPIHQIVYDKNENNHRKLAGVWSGAANTGINLAMLLDGSESNIRLYLGACGERNRLKAEEQADILYRSLTGNFPGIRSKSNSPILKKQETSAAIERCTSSYKAICAVSGVASVNNSGENQVFAQGIEKVVEAMEGKKFSVILIAYAADDETLLRMREGYEQLYTQLTPYAKYSHTIDEKRSASISKTLGDTLTKSISRVVSHGLTIEQSKQTSIDGEICYSGEVKARTIIAPFSIEGNSSIGLSVKASKSWSESRSETENETDTEEQSAGVTTSEGKTVTVGMGHTRQLNYEDKTISEILSRIEQQLKRLRCAEGTGMFAMAAYFLAEDLPTAKAAASTYKAIISGVETGIEKTAINSWTMHHGMEQVLAYLQKLRHPVFYLDPGTTVTPASAVTANELAIHMGLPRNSIAGIPVNESVAYGVNVLRLDGAETTGEQLELGSLFHLGKSLNRAVGLPLESLKSHILIAGTMSAGKSNTIYHLLSSLCHREGSVPFLVIDPVKGDYKREISDLPEIKVYGTNPQKSPLLRLDPFYFPKDIHVMEHIDRLVDLFNVCWPVHAAMPVLLKIACERAYRAAGWDLCSSVNQRGTDVFPAFADVAGELKAYINEAACHADHKSDYTVLLAARLDLLATGLNAQIFTSGGLTDESLFEHNVIVDLSRLGSAETKALIMGMLLIRLREYRASGQRPQYPLRHVTVLEEAHHLLKRTSTGRAAEGAGLAGGSAEMLSDLLAALRAEGEGIIIADRSPGVLDLSVVGNTNTKIVLRLPERHDRELVGNAMGMSGEQIAELAHLPDGVAAVYQSSWREAVLVKLPL